MCVLCVRVDGDGVVAATNFCMRGLHMRLISIHELPLSSVPYTLCPYAEDTAQSPQKPTVGTSIPFDREYVCCPSH